MLNMWTGKVEDVTKVQTLLFSATLPDWVNKVIHFMDLPIFQDIKYLCELTIYSGFIVAFHEVPERWQEDSWSCRQWETEG
jgi:hypothetical protein